MKLVNIKDDFSNWHDELKHDRELIKEVNQLIKELNKGIIRSAEKIDNFWITNIFVKKAILAYFKMHESKEMLAGCFSFYDKVPLKKNLKSLGIRAVPGAIIRYGAYIESGTVLMPCFVNIGARVGSGTMVDTWATIGSSAQIGKNCHISGGVGIGGVLEPLNALPVIIEDDVFIGARSEIAEGVVVRKRSVISMGVFIGASTKIFDARSESFGKIYEREIPEGSVIIPGTRSKTLKIKNKEELINIYSPIIIKTRDEKTDLKTALNVMLR
jgi:2,3,4,5-tetrahydropyridine-2,6-dicarboxylate N-succinyltransferase